MPLPITYAQKYCMASTTFQDLHSKEITKRDFWKNCTSGYFKKPQQGLRTEYRNNEMPLKYSDFGLPLSQKKEVLHIMDITFPHPVLCLAQK